MSPGERVASPRPGTRARPPTDRVVVDFANFARARHRAVGDRHRRRRAALPRRAHRRGRHHGRGRVARAAVGAQGRQRHARAPGAARHHGEGRRRPRRSPPSSARTSSPSRSSAPPPTSSSCATSCASSAPARGSIAKIEKIEAYENLDEIIAVSDGLMVARGDYGVEAGVARVPLMQKDTIYRATQDGKFVITATQMLESMIHAAEPTRAEAADVANAVIDGTSAVMLSAETSVGAYPVEAVRAMAEIARGRRGVRRSSTAARKDVALDTTGEAVMHAAVELADALDAAALIVPVVDGRRARACAKYRRRRPIIALAHQPGVANQLTLEWGVYPTSMPTASNVDEMIDMALIAARDFAGLEHGRARRPDGGPPHRHAGRDEPRDGARDPLSGRRERRGVHHLRGDRRGRHDRASDRVPVTPEEIADVGDRGGARPARPSCTSTCATPRRAAARATSRSTARWSSAIRASGVDPVLNLTAGMGGDLVLGGVDAPLPPDAAGTDMVGRRGAPRPRRGAAPRDLHARLRQHELRRRRRLRDGQHAGHAARDGRADPGARRPARARGLRHRPPRAGRAPDRARA